MPDEPSGQVNEPSTALPEFDEVCQLPDTDVSVRSSRKQEVRITTDLKTGADFLASQITPLTAYREGTQVRHAEHGQGTIVSVSGRGPKRIARIQFSDGEHSFRLAFADLEVVDV